jgi:hypothetical protein
VLRHKLDKLSLIAVCCGVGFRDVARLAHYRALASCRSSAPSRGALLALVEDERADSARPALSDLPGGG